MKKNKKNNRGQLDIQDTEKDQKELKSDEGSLDLPDVNDIPRQKKNRQSIASGSADTTISSSDEEGGVALNEDENIVSDKGNNVSASERKLLDDAFDPESTEEEPIDDLALDNKDNEGEVLNEKGMRNHKFGDDLDSGLIEEEDEEDE